MDDLTLGGVMLESALSVFQKHKDWADQAIAQLSEGDLRRPLDENTNSIAVIMKHVAGNLHSRWTDFLTTDGEKPWRNRDQEFVDDFQSLEDILAYWEKGWECLFGTLKAIGPEDLQKEISIRGEPHSVPLAIERSLAHCAYHVGQILMLARHWAGANWRTITIPRGESQSYNKNVWGKGNYKGSNSSDGIV